MRCNGAAVSEEECGVPCDCETFWINKDDLPARLPSCRTSLPEVEVEFDRISRADDDDDDGEGRPSAALFVHAPARAYKHLDRHKLL